MMQQEQKQTIPKTESLLSQPERNQIITLIQNTYQGKTTTQVKKAEEQLMILLSTNSKIVESFFVYLRPPFERELNFRRACTNLIKKYYHQLYKDKSTKKDRYIQLGYDVLMAVGYIDYGVKETIAVALEYIFNKDELEQYKPKWAQHVKSQLAGLTENPQAWTIQTLEVIHGLVLLAIALLNSYVEPEEQVDFVNTLLNPLCKAGSLCAQFARQNINQSTITKILFACPQKIFQFLQLSTQRLLQQQQLIQQQVNQYKTSQHLSNLILEYLYLFSTDNQTIITKYNDLNQIKASIIQILYTMTAFDCVLDISIVSILFSTFVSQSCRNQNLDDDDNSDFNDRIVCKTIGTLEKMLSKKIHYQFFCNNKIQIVFALLLYSKTSQYQLADLYDEPEKFVMLAEEYSESFASSPITKIRASHFLKTFVNLIDEGLVNITQLCVIFITGSLQPSQSDSQILKAAKQTYSSFQFMSLTNQQKLDISFMVLTVLSQKIQQRSQIRSIVVSVLMTNFQALFKVTNELVLIRFIRLIGYYPNAVYFNFINKCMFVSKANMLEGMTCFDRISRNKQYLETFPLMHMVFLGIADCLQVRQPIFQRLVLENYENILKKSQQLYIKILTIIFDNFTLEVKNFSVNKSKQLAIICLNYIQKMIKAEKEQQYLDILKKVYFKMQQIGINLDIFDDNFIGIECMLLGKSLIVEPRVENFVLAFSRQQKVSHYSNTSEYFQLLSKYTVKAQNVQIFSDIHTNLTTYIGQTETEQFNYAIVPQLTHCIGHIAINNYQRMQINQNYLLFIARLACKKEQVRGKFTMYQSWYTFLVLHYFYVFAPKLREFLGTHNLYHNFLMALFKTQWSCKIQRKVAVIALQELLGYEDDEKISFQIIKYCVEKLKEQKEKYEVKLRIKTKKQKRRQNIERGMTNQQIDMEQQDDRQQQQQFRSNKEKDKDKQQDGLFKKFKHPFDKICEFSMFRQRIQGLAHQIKTINEENIPGITEVLQRQWHLNSLRRILRVSK